MKSKRQGWTRRLPSLTNISFLPPDETVMPPLSSLGHAFRQFQDLLKWLNDTMQITLKEVPDSHHKHLDVLHTFISAWVPLPISEALHEPVKTIWQTPATLPPTCKQTDNKYYVQARDSEFLFSPSTKISDCGHSQ